MLAHLIRIRAHMQPCIPPGPEPESKPSPLLLWHERGSGGALDSTLAHCARALPLDHTQHAALRGLFCSNKRAWARRARGPSTYTPSETGFAVWGFVRSSKARDAVLGLLQRALRPRVLFAGETRPSFFEAFLLVRSDFVASAPSPPELEAWLEGFVECLGISGGVSRFESYMDAGTVALLDRIERLGQGKRLGTLCSPRNRDFYRFFTLMRARLGEERDCRLHTGRDLSLQTMVQLQAQAATQRRALERTQLQVSAHAQQVLLAEQELRRFRTGVLEAARILVELERTGAVGADALAGLLEHLGVRQARVPLAQLRPVPARAH
mgnify:CR=1 FL=1